MKEYSYGKSGLTQRAPDGWDSARFLKLALNYGGFPFPSFVLPSRR
jgi:hypothetical protein